MSRLDLLLVIGGTVHERLESWSGKVRDRHQALVGVVTGD